MLPLYPALKRRAKISRRYAAKNTPSSYFVYQDLRETEKKEASRVFYSSRGRLRTQVCVSPIFLMPVNVTTGCRKVNLERNAIWTARATVH